MEQYAIKINYVHIQCLERRVIIYNCWYDHCTILYQSTDKIMLDDLQLYLHIAKLFTLFILNHVSLYGINDLIMYSNIIKHMIDNYISIIYFVFILCFPFLAGEGHFHEHSRKYGINPTTKFDGN